MYENAHKYLIWIITNFCVLSSKSMVWMYKDQIGFTHAIIRTQWYHELLQITVCYFIFSHKFAVRQNAGIGRLFMTAIQLSGLQKLVQSLITTKGDCLGVKEGFGVFLNSYFLYKYMKYKMRRYPRCILSCQNWYLCGLKYVCILFFRDKYWRIFNCKVLLVLIFVF